MRKSVKTLNARFCVYLAGTSLGKLLRTIYLCDYYTLPEFRDEIYRTLERSESVHALQRAIHIGTIPGVTKFLRFPVLGGSKECLDAKVLFDRKHSNNIHQLLMECLHSC